MRFLLLAALAPVFVFAQPPVVTAVVNGGSFYGTLSPGVLAVVQGRNFDGLSAITVAGRSAPIISNVATPIGAAIVQMPFELQPGPASVAVTTAAGISEPFVIVLETYSPVLTGMSRAPCLTASTDDVIEAYAVGLGATDPPTATGALPHTAVPTVQRPTVTVGGKPAEVLASLLVTWKVAIYQVNFRVPSGLTEGIHKVSLSIGGESTDEKYTTVDLAVNDDIPGVWTFKSPYRAAPEAIVLAETCGRAIFTDVPVSADPKNPPNILRGASVKVRDSTGVERAAPVLSAGPGQVTYVIPVGTATGDARITITNSDGAIFTAVLPVENMAPRVFLESSWSSEAPFPAATLTRIRDGQQVTSPLVFPIDLGADSDQLYLSVYGTGFRNRSSLNRVRARIGDIDIPVEYAGPQGQSGGLDQINLKLPRTLVGGGLLELNVAVDGTMIYGGHLQFR